MITGQAEANLTYGINANAMVLELNEVIEVVVSKKDTGSHPVLRFRKILHGMEGRD